MVELATVRDLLKICQKENLNLAIIYFDSDKNDTLSRLAIKNIVNKNGCITKEELKEYLENIKNIAKNYDKTALASLPITTLNHLIEEQFVIANNNCRYHVINDIIVEQKEAQNSIIICNDFNYCKLKRIKDKFSLFEGSVLDDLKFVKSILLSKITTYIISKFNIINYTLCLQKCYTQMQSVKNFTNATIKAIMQINSYNCLESQIILPSYITQSEIDNYIKDCDCTGNLMIGIHKNYCPKFRMNITFDEFTDIVASYNIKQKLIKKEKFNFKATQLIINEITFQDDSVKKLSDWFNEYIDNAKSDEPESYDYYIEPDDLKYYPYWKR